MQSPLYQRRKKRTFHTMENEACENGDCKGWTNIRVLSMERLVHLGQGKIRVCLSSVH